MPDNFYRFRASKSLTNLRLTSRPKHQLQGFQISINGKPTDQLLDRVSFKVNDIVEIRRVDGLRDYPLVDFHKEFVKELLAPLPRLGNVRALSGAFEGCKSLQRVSRDLFVNNPKLTDFTDAFKGCSALTLDLDLNPNGSVKLDGFASGCKTQATLHSRSPSRVQGYVDRAKGARCGVR
ncbi:MAG TPA: hypothetical protein IAC89_03370 [Candidatus Aphodousia faecalis]|nr:hypothetical protein [Candidatus Aphodousia faecalis]